MRRGGSPSTPTCCGGHILTPVQVLPYPQAEGRANSRKHEVLSGQPEVGIPLALLNDHLARWFAYPAGTGCLFDLELLWAQ